MANTFDCPKCSAPLDYDGNGLTVHCPFCGSSVVVPEQLRPQQDADMEELIGEAQILAEIIAELQAGHKINAIKKYRELTGAGLAEAKMAVENLEAGQSIAIHSSNAQVHITQARLAGQSSKATSAGLVSGIVIIGLVALLVFGALQLFPRKAAVPVQPTTPAPPSPTPFAHLALAFGKQGNGAGYFSDARSIAVDSHGRVFVGDYHPGRIQAFAADGAFLWQQSLPDETDYVRALAADLQGKLYALVGRNIGVYDAATGKQLAQWEPRPQQIGWYYAITTTQKGEVLAVSPRELVKFDDRGNLLLQIGGLKEDFLKRVGVKDSSIDITGIAVDGTDAIYISTTGHFLLKLDANGNLIDRLNGEGADESIDSIAVDGQGRVAWAYSGKLVVTDSNGKYLGNFKTDPLSDIEFNLNGQVVGISRTPPQVVVYTIGS